MNENELSSIIISKCIGIHKTLGPGLFENVYEEVLSYELVKAGLQIDRQKNIVINYEGLIFDKGFKADLIINSKVLVELKSVKELHDIHKKQVLTYIRLAHLKLGLLINFNEKLLKNGIVRVVNGL